MIRKVEISKINVTKNDTVNKGISLVVWGENAQNEYGGPASAAENNVLTRRWLEEFGGLLGLRVSDLIGQEGIREKHLIQYTYPTDEDLKRIGVSTSPT